MTNQDLWCIIYKSVDESDQNDRLLAAMAQVVEHILGKDEVPSSNLGSSSFMTDIHWISVFVLSEIFE